MYFVLVSMSLVFKRVVQEFRWIQLLWKQKHHKINKRLPERATQPGNLRNMKKTVRKSQQIKQCK